jgi:hypothetical protein
VAIELFDPQHVGVDLFCDGLSELEICVLSDDGPAMLSDYAGTVDEASHLVLYAAEHCGWIFDLELQRWLCPDCLAAREEKKSDH